MALREHAPSRRAARRGPVLVEQSSPPAQEPAPPSVEPSSPDADASSSSPGSSPTAAITASGRVLSEVESHTVGFRRSAAPRAGDDQAAVVRLAVVRLAEWLLAAARQAAVQARRVRARKRPAPPVHSRCPSLLQHAQPPRRPAARPGPARPGSTHAPCAASPAPAASRQGPDFPQPPLLLWGPAARCGSTRATRSSAPARRCCSQPLPCHCQLVSHQPARQPASHPSCPLTPLQIFFAKVPRTISEEELVALFGRYGTVAGINLFRAFLGAPTTKVSGRPAGRGGGGARCRWRGGNCTSPTQHQRLPCRCRRGACSSPRARRGQPAAPQQPLTAPRLPLCACLCAPRRAAAWSRWARTRRPLQQSRAWMTSSSGPA
jgi:hypothetical protein